MGFSKNFFDKMKLNLLIFFVWSVAEGFRFRSFRPSSFIKPSIIRQKLPSLPKPSTIRQKLPSLPPLPKLPRPKLPSREGLNTFFNGGNLLAGISLAEAERLQNEQLKAQRELQQAQFDAQKDMKEHVKVAEEMGAPQICLDCYKEFEKMHNAINEEAKAFCSQFANLPGWYDAEKQTCDEQSWEVFFQKKAIKIFEPFGGRNNKCLKAKSQYLTEVENNVSCQTADDKNLRCIYDTYHQLTETEKSCSD